MDFIGNALQYEKMGYRKVRKNCLVGLVLPGMSVPFITIVISWIYLSVWMVHRCSGQKINLPRSGVPVSGERAHNEKFMQNQNIVNNLRIRGSYGETGSQQFSSYQALSTFQSYTGKRYIIWNRSELMGLGNAKVEMAG